MNKLQETKEEVIVWATLSEALYQIGINFRDDNYYTSSDAVQQLMEALESNNLKVIYNDEKERPAE